MLQIIVKAGFYSCLLSILTACMATQVEPTIKTVVKPPIQAVVAPENLVDYKNAIAAAKQGDIDEAIELFAKTTGIRPKFVDAYINLGLQYMQKNELDKAEQAFLKVIALDVSNHIAYNHRGIIMRMRGDFTAAKEMYQLALKYDPNNANVHLNAAILYDIYLYEPDLALYYYKQYQLLTGESDQLVGKWIVDLERRVTAKQ